MESDCRRGFVLVPILADRGHYCHPGHLDWEEYGKIERTKMEGKNFRLGYSNNNLYFIGDLNRTTFR